MLLLLKGKKKKKSILLVKYLAICVLLRVRLEVCAVASDFESYTRVSPKAKCICSLNMTLLRDSSLSLYTTHMIT